MAYRVTNRETGAIISQKTYPFMSEALPEQKRARERGIPADVIFDPHPATREQAGYPSLPDSQDDRSSKLLDSQDDRSSKLPDSQDDRSSKLPFGLDRIFGRKHESDLR